MGKKMLIDAAHREETRVAVVTGNRVENFDFESASKRPLRGNIYLAKVTRVEPSLQAAFIEYGGNRHGFLAFSEIHPDYYQIPVADRQKLLEAEAAEQRAEAEEEDAEAEGRAPFHVRHHDDDHEDAGDFDDAGEPDDIGDVADDDDGAADGDAEQSVMATRAETAESLSTDADETDFGEDFGEETPRAELEEVDDQHDAEDIETAADSDDDDHETGSDQSSRATSETDDVSAGDRRGRRRGRNSRGSGDDQPRRRSRPRAYKIQEVIKRRQILLVQVVKEERGNKGAALTTYLSLAGRYCVLMPNTARGGGISRKITNPADRRRLKEAMSEMEVAEGMGLIVRTAGANRTKAEIKRDFDYLLRLWENIRDLTLKSTAPALIYEEGDLIKRSIRDLYSKDIDEIVVDGDAAYKDAKEFMRMLMPSHAKNVKRYGDRDPIYQRYGVQQELDSLLEPTVTLKSGGYVVINPTEALVSIDVNSGRSTKEHNIEATALSTNMEAAEEIARQLRLRDMAGLIVIDFIDMDEPRNNRAVERKLKDNLKQDRARIQVGRISSFGLLEMSRQRMRSGVLEGSTEICPHCKGTGFVRSTESTALQVLRAIEVEALKGKAKALDVSVPTAVAVFILNQKRAKLLDIERRCRVSIYLLADGDLIAPDFSIKRTDERMPEDADEPEALNMESAFDDDDAFDDVPEEEDAAEPIEAESDADIGSDGDGDGAAETQMREPRKRRRPRGRRKAAANGDGLDSADGKEGDKADDADGGSDASTSRDAAPQDDEDLDEDGKPRKRRRRGRRGGRRHRRAPGGETGQSADAETGGEVSDDDTDYGTDAPILVAYSSGAVDPMVVASPQERGSQDQVDEVQSRNGHGSHAATATDDDRAPDADGEPDAAEETVSAPEEQAEDAAPEATGGEAGPAPQHAQSTPDTREPKEAGTPAGPSKRGWWQRRLSS